LKKVEASRPRSLPKPRWEMSATDSYELALALEVEVGSGLWRAMKDPRGRCPTRC
jgi:hypothetical protein